MKKVYAQIFVLVLISFPGLSYSKDLVLENKVIVLKSENLASLNGKAFIHYSLAASHKGKVIPIPFQFDELTEDGFIYTEGTESTALKMEGVHSEIKGQANIFDEDDELLFMLRDAGERIKNTKEPLLAGKAVSEIEVIGYDNIRRYVYLVKDARIHSETVYVQYSSDIGRAETDKYSLQVSKKNALVWDDFSFFSFNGANPQKPIDTMKLGVRANVIPAALVPVYLNNKHLKATPLADKTGPIRATTTYRQTLNYLGAPWFASKLQIRHYESKVDYHFVLRMPEARRQMLANLKVRISTDGRELKGSKIVFSSDPEFIGSVDGVVSEEEQRVIEIQPDLDQKNWIWLDTQNNFETFTTFEVSQETKVDSDFNKPKLEFRFEDNEDKKDKPEFYAGQSPDAGFEIKMPQFGKVFMKYSINMFANTQTTDIKDLALNVFYGVAINEYPIN